MLSLFQKFTIYKEEMNKMGWAKYYEDNMSIYVGRMVMKESVPSYNVKVKPTHAVQIQIAQKKKPVAEVKKKKEIDYVKREKQNGCQGLELSFKVGIEDKMIKKLQVNGWWWSKFNACWCNLDTSGNRKYAESFKRYAGMHLAVVSM